MSAYEASDYKSYLRALLREKKQKVSSRFTFERMATACGIQKTYLSRVLNGDKGHLSADQLYQACAFLGVAPEDRHYLFLLRELEQSSVSTRRAELQRTIADIKAKHRRSESHLEAEPITTASDLAEYYLDPNVMLAHIFLSVPRFRSNVRKIRQQLDLPEGVFALAVNKLERMGLVALEAGEYRLTKDRTHLSSDSSFYRPYRILQRLKSIERIQKLSDERTYNFSVVFSADPITRAEIQRRFLALLKGIEGLVKNAPCEEVYQMNFDLFDWSL